MNIKFMSLLIGLTVFIACDNQDGPQALKVVSLEPSHTSTQVSRETAIQVTFNQSMDVSTCESLFGLFQGQLEDIPEDMMGAMSGEFTWNEDLTMMTFQPSNMLMDSTMYSICLQEGMQAEHDHEAGMMTDHPHFGGLMMSGMMDFGEPASNGIISYFTTE